VVLIQIFTALTAYLLLAYMKFMAEIGLSVQQIFQLVQLNLMGTSSLSELLKQRLLKNNSSMIYLCLTPSFSRTAIIDDH